MKARLVLTGAQLAPAGAPGYESWRRSAARRGIIFGYDHFHVPSLTEIVNATPVLHGGQPEVTNFSTEIRHTADGYDFAETNDVIVSRDGRWGRTIVSVRQGGCSKHHPPRRSRGLGSQLASHQGGNALGHPEQ
jgi:hypothetical protein